MIRALLDGSKTQTRRVIKLPTKTHRGSPIYENPKMGGWGAGTIGGKGCYLDPMLTVPAPERACVSHQTCGTTVVPWPNIGDRLWVREAHAILPRTAYRGSIGTGSITQIEHPTDEYSAAVFREGFDRSGPPRWRPSIHMPRWSSRLTLNVTDVRVQRLHDISDGDAIAEGAPAADIRMHPEMGTARHWFADLWNSIHGPDAWDANPWVTAISFDVKRGNIDEYEVME